MPRLDRLPELSRKNLLMLPVQVNDTAPFTRLPRPLSACRLAIVTTAGLHRREDRPFGPGEQTFRVLPASAPATDIVQSHTSLGFDRVPIMRDLNISYPVDRLRELIARGELGGTGPNHYSFMGAQRDLKRIHEETGPEVGRRLRDEGVDAALITPT
ncbi:MAG TPA: glycine/sarcosine/betaine reductase selenoprotein B family protein [Methylomirabilota bacterium]|nr:glycine/sarcosine/betaine reductase selenoprotein B family protein [Methylomirabilota bacterium]